ncbi:MAG: hypothetical protein IKR53_05745 [Clostridia bacterium]|nr:hypothetical protein [Clostridia bacterium]MBR6290929.1 hypothetical protein [Clostridia bacterium]
MKKIIAVAIAAVMTVALFAITVGAESLSPNGGWDPSVVVNVKKANPANVVKDGKISSNEYEKFEVDLTEDNSPLQITYITGDDMTCGFDMLKTMEYYFSWDETHGINIAIRNKPAVIQQLLDIKEGDKPEDDFCRNVAWGISAKTENDTVLYFALGKRTDNGKYLEGHYGSDQLGVNHNYNPTEGTDYIINYDYGTGYCTIEWSIPLSNFLTGGGEGSKLEFSLWADAGTSTVEGDFSGESGGIYGVVLGDFGFMVNLKSMINQVTYLLTGEELAGTPDPVPVPTPGPDPTPGPIVNPDPDKYEIKKDENGNDIVVDKETGEKVDVTPAKTGDPMIIMAAVAAVSAAGAFIVRKKRH